jgi:ABC-type transport system involved in multi-copper enzyme maturation permease subunit
VGSEGKEVIDEQMELQHAVGLVIRRDQFPDKLFAPAKRVDLLPDGANPVYDKEMSSEIFSQGTLMLRVVIQVSMFLAIPLMAFCLYIQPQHAPWYISYVILFNMLVGPVFSAGSVTSERERETLELLLTTIITPQQILWGKLISGLRVSSVLTLFLLWPLLLACLMVTDYWQNFPTLACYLVIVLLTCLTTGTLALFCSTLFKKTSVSLMTTYLLVVVLFAAPLGVERFAQTFFPKAPETRTVEQATFISPIAAAFALPLNLDRAEFDDIDRPARWELYASFLGFYGFLNAAMLGTMTWLFNTRWRVAY